MSNESLPFLNERPMISCVVIRVPWREIATPGERRLIRKWMWGTVAAWGSVFLIAVILTGFTHGSANGTRGFAKADSARIAIGSDSRVPLLH